MHIVAPGLAHDIEQAQAVAVIIIFASNVGRIDAPLDRFVNELQPLGMGVGKIDIENVMIEGDMLDQLPGHIKGPQMDDLILATDGFHNLPRRSREIFHE